MPQEFKWKQHLRTTDGFFERMQKWIETTHRQCHMMITSVMPSETKIIILNKMNRGYIMLPLPLGFHHWSLSITDVNAVMLSVTGPPQ